MVNVIVLDWRRRKERDENEEEEDGGGNGGDSWEEPIEVVVAPPGIGHESMAAARDV